VIDEIWIMGILRYWEWPISAHGSPGSGWEPGGPPGDLLAVPKAKGAVMLSEDSQANDSSLNSAMKVPTARVLLSLLSAFLLILSFPRFDLGFLAWIAVIPLFVALKDMGLKSAFGLSFLAGISFLMGVFYWINVINGFGWTDFVLLGVYLGSYFGLFGLALSFISQRTKLSPVFTAPFIWVSMEYLRSHAGFLGLPWALMGHSQYLNIPMIQISSITGAYGVSFLIVMVNALLSEIILYCGSKKQGTLVQSWPKLVSAAVVTIFLFTISLTYGFVRVSNQHAGDKVTITAIQGNIPQDVKWNPEFKKLHLAKHVKLTKQAAKLSRASLIVWPEAAAEGFFKRDLRLLKTFITLAKETNTHLLIGSSARPKFGSREFRRKNSFNSAFLVSPMGRIAGQYNKIHLLPFAEYFPYGDSFPWPSRLVSRTSNFIPGNEYTVFNVNGAKFGVTICWENIFPDLFRKFVMNGAHFMVNIANEAWFGETAAPYQFLSMSVFRAVENGISIVRSANTGISGFIDPYGRIMGTVKVGDKDIFVQGYLTKAIPLLQRKTFYTIYGDIFAKTSLVTALLMIGLSFLKTRR